MPSVGRRGSRGNKFNRSLKAEATKLIPHVSQTDRISDAAKYYEVSDLNAAQSITAKEYLRIGGKRGLLLRGNPFAFNGDTINRQASRSKRISYGVDSQFSTRNQPRGYTDLSKVRIK